MKNFFSKKPVVLTTLLMALGLAVYLNYYFASIPAEKPSANSQVSTNLGDSQYVDNPSVTDPEPENYFTQARRNREQAHRETLDVIKNVMDDVKANEQMQQQAAEQLKQLTGVMEREIKIENLVKAAGFSECLTYIEDTGCYVVVQCDSLTEQQALQITGIAVDQSGIPAQKINIVTVE